MTTTAVLGAGGLGAAMAERLAGQGHEVRLWNRTPEKARSAAEGVDGVTAHEDVADAVAGAAAVLTVVRDGDAAAEVARAALPAVDDGAVWVQASTVGPQASARLRDIADDAGVPMLDAPVSGSTDPARTGKLVWLVSGPDDALERVRPVLDALGQKVVHCGPAAEASALKVAVNAWMTGATVLMADVLAACEPLGTQAEDFLGVLDGGPLGMPYALGKAAMMGRHDYPPGFAADLALKDVDLAASTLGGLPPSLQVVRDRLQEAVDAGRGREDLAVVAEVGSDDGDG